MFSEQLLSNSLLKHCVPSTTLSHGARDEHGGDLVLLHHVVYTRSGDGASAVELYLNTL